MSEVMNSKTEADMEGLLRLDPFSSLNAHFGMLLGVEDFRTVDAYHRGKMWLHSAWLHRQGTIWGLGVSVDLPNSEVRVAPGLAVDGLGRELYLHGPACLNLPLWFAQEDNQKSLDMADALRKEDDDWIFDAHVAIRFKACLSRQVPALSEPCNGANTSTAYSRINETVEVSLRPGLAPEWRTPAGSLPFHRVRLLFALEAAIEEDGAVIADDQEVLDVRLEVLALPTEQQPATYLKWLRYFSAKDEMAQRPAAAEGASPLFPAQSPDWIPLANLENIRLIPEGEGWKLHEADIDNFVRPVHLPTSTIQELLCGPLFSSLAAPAEGVPAEASPALPEDAGGPRIDPESVESKGEFIYFKISGTTLMKASVDERAVEVTSFDVRDGWIEEVVKKVSFNTKTKRMEVELRDDPGGRLVRLIVKGTGPTPLLGKNRIPLAGSVGGAPGSLDNGVDFITMFRTES